MENISSIFKDNTLYALQNTSLNQESDKVKGNLEATLAVVYQKQSDAILDENNKAFLLKMLSAVNFNTTNALIVNDNNAVKFNQLKTLPNINKILFFGSTRQQIGISLNIKRYKIYSIQAINCLFIDDLSVLKDDQQRKGALWSLMKTMFDIA